MMAVSHQECGAADDLRGIRERPITSYAPLVVTRECCVQTVYLMAATHTKWSCPYVLPQSVYIRLIFVRWEVVFHFFFCAFVQSVQLPHWLLLYNCTSALLSVQ